MFGVIASIGVVSSIIFGYLNFKITVENSRLNKDLVKKYNEVDSLRRELDTVSISVEEARTYLDSVKAFNDEIKKHNFIVIE